MQTTLVALLTTAGLAASPPERAPQQLAAAVRGDSLPARAAATAVRALVQPPRVDGRLDDPAWVTAPVFGDFVQRDPDEGRPATERTEMRVVYTDAALYVGVRAYDSQPERITGHLTRRDADSPSDWIILGIDSYFDRRTAFVFAVNPVGVKRDWYIFNDVEEDDSWDAVWDVAASRDGGGWTAEFRIPFSQLRFARAASQRFGFNVVRKINRLNEEDHWRLIPRGAPGTVSLFGDLAGLDGLRPPRRLEILPYSVGRSTWNIDQPGNPFRPPREGSTTVGADLKLGLGSNLTLDATINPDFGQVEADPAVVNLSAFETFYPEKRPFFTEGVNIFRFPLSLGDGDGANEQLFYSRRVGRRPQGSPDVPPGGFGEELQQTTILAAAKLSGKTASGWTIGLLAARTAEERAEVVDANGVRSRDIVEPGTTQLVGRLARDFRHGRTVVGLFGTYLDRDLPVDMPWLRSSAFTIGADWNHRFARDQYRFRGSAVLSNVRGSAEAIDITQRSSARYYQRPDNDYVTYDPTRTSLSGFSGQVEFGKIAGDWRFLTALDTRSPGFEVNDLGYQREADYVTQVVWVGRRWLQPGKVFRRFSLNVNQWNAWSYGWDHLNTGGNVNASFTLLNYWGGYFGVNRNWEGLSTGMLRGGPAIRRPGGTNGWAGFYSDERKALRAELNVWGWRQDESGSWEAGLNPFVAWRPSGRVDLRVGPSFNRNRNQAQYLTDTVLTGRTEYLFGQLSQSTVAMTVRANITFTPRLTLQVYAEPFYSAGSYSDVARVTDPRGDRFQDRFQALGATRDANGDFAVDVDGGGTDVVLPNPDFSYASFRSNVVLRWEYRPGSTLFLVWQQNRGLGTSDGRYDPDGALRDLFGTEPENVFLVKVNYWFSL
jgi:hypothetical protein